MTGLAIFLDFTKINWHYMDNINGDTSYFGSISLFFFFNSFGNDWVQCKPACSYLPWKQGPDWTVSCQIFFLAATSHVGVHYCIHLIKDLRWTLLQFLLFLPNTYNGKKSSPSSPAVWSLQRISLAWLVLLNSYCVKWHVCTSPTEIKYQNLFGNPYKTEWVHFC